MEGRKEGREKKEESEIYNSICPDMVLQSTVSTKRKCFKLTT